MGTYFTGMRTNQKKQALMRVLERTNIIRASVGAPPVEWDNDLQKACTRHIYDLAKNEVPPPLPHVGTDGSTLSERAWASGFGAGAERAFFYAGENLAMDFREQLFPDDIVEAWKNSPTHYANMIEPEFTFLGVDVLVSEDGNQYWCQVFGKNENRK
jgi:uncharacterized protein YkwD